MHDDETKGRRKAGEGEEQDFGTKERIPGIKGVDFCRKKLTAHHPLHPLLLSC